MKKQYAGLNVEVVTFSADDIIATSGNCVAMIQLELVNGICISDDWQQQITYVGDKG